MSIKKYRVLLVSPYDSKRVGGIGTWSKSILDYYKDSDTYEIIFQNTANSIKSNIKSGRLYPIILGVIDTAAIILALFYNLLIKKPDVVHYTSSAGRALVKDRVAVFFVKTIFHKRFIIHWHFGRIPDICKAKGREYSRLMGVVRRVDENIVLDRESLSSLLSEGCQNVTNIPNPMTSANYCATKGIDVYSANAARNSGEVLFVGHIIENKGILDLVKCCCDCEAVTKLFLVGPVLPDMKNKILLLSAERKNSEWLEFKGELQREEVYAFYRNCTVFCLPSYTEGFPYVVLEAMSFGCPIVATRVGAIPEMLQENSGLIVSPHNNEDLMTALEEVLMDKDMRDKLSVNAYNRVMKTYTHEVIFKQYESLWLTSVN